MKTARIEKDISNSEAPLVFMSPQNIPMRVKVTIEA